jgi:hypothetical protein
MSRSSENCLSSEAEPVGRDDIMDLARKCSLAGGAYIAGVVLVQLLAGFVLNQEVVPWACLANRGLWAGLGLVLAYVYLAERGVAEASIITGFWLVFALCVFCLLFWGDDRLQQYGDSNLIVRFARKGMTIAKWLAGTALLSWIHDFVHWVPALHDSVDVDTAAATRRHLAVFTAIVMIGSTLFFLRRWPGRLSILLPISTPVWFLFSSGYVEYYPLIAPIFLAALVWIFERPFSERGGIRIGVLAAFLFPLLYIGFMPIALAVAGIYCIEQPRRAPWVLAAGATTGLLGVALLWPDTFLTYRHMLRANINPGEGNLFYPLYVGNSAGPDSIFLRSSFALSIVHLREVLFMYTFGAGLLVLPLLSLGIGSTLSRGLGEARWLRDGRVWLGVVIVTWQLGYLVWMMPKYGPLKDIDLFFATYVSLAFFAGRLLDLQPALAVGSNAGLRGPLLAGILGCSAGSVSMLVIEGLRLPV